MGMKRAKLVDTINRKVEDYNKLMNEYNTLMDEYNKLVRDTDKTIKEQDNRIKEISTADGISPEHQKIIDDLEQQSVKDNKRLSDYDIQVADYMRQTTEDKKLIGTLKSDIIAMKSRPRKDRFSKVHSKKPSVNINIPLKDVPKQALIQSIYFIETSDIGLKHTTFKEIVKILGYDGSLTNCKIMGSLLRNMHFKVKRSREGMILLLDNDRNRQKLVTFYAKYCDDKK